MTDSRVAVITGASRGLGLALARRLSEEGWRLIVDARNADTLLEATAELPDPSGVTVVPGNIRDQGHRRQLARVAREGGGIDLVVNNASTLGTSPLPPLLEYPPHVLEDVLITNVVAPLALLQELRPAFRPGVRIINVTSDAAVERYEGWGGYGASKAALEQISAVLATENPNLRVYWVDPGDMRTQMHQDAFPDEDISDRPLPETVVPGFLEIIHSELPSGRYRATELVKRALVRS